MSESTTQEQYVFALARVMDACEKSCPKSLARIGDYVLTLEEKIAALRAENAKMRKALECVPELLGAHARHSIDTAFQECIDIARAAITPPAAEKGEVDG